MKTLLYCGVAMAVIVVFAVAPAAADDGWKLPLWNPFKSSSPSPVRNAKGSGSSVVGQAASSVAKGTKKVWNTTVDVVTLKPVRQQFAPKQKSDLGLGFKPDPRKKPASTSWFGSMFKPKPSQRGPDTVDEFFSLERPRQ